MINLNLKSSPTSSVESTGFVQFAGRPIFQFIFLLILFLGGVLMNISLNHRLELMDLQNKQLRADILLLREVLRSRDQEKGARLITLNETPKTVEEVLALSQKSGLKVLSIARHDKKKSTYRKMDTLPIELETSSDFQSLGLFMNGLNNLSQGMVLVENFVIARDVQDFNKVKSKIRLHISLKKGRHGGN